MAEPEKHKRKVALGKFTRVHNTLSKLLDGDPPPPTNLVEPQCENLKLMWTVFEDAHDDLMERTKTLLTTLQDSAILMNRGRDITLF